jgi:hypothetical protein
MALGDAVTSWMARRRAPERVWHFQCGLGRFRLVEREYASVSAQSIRAARISGENHPVMSTKDTSMASNW